MTDTDARIDSRDREMILRLAHDLTGIHVSGVERFEVLIQNVSRRIQTVRCKDLRAYLAHVASHPRELGQLISALSIHTTSWFRELPHYRNLERDLMERLVRGESGIRYRVLSAACSSGEELYSFGMVLETFRRRMRGFDYELVGLDVDPISTQLAGAGHYELESLAPIPHLYRRFLIRCPGEGRNRFAIDPQIRSRTRFVTGNLLNPRPVQEGLFDHVVCRNVLIYFNEETVGRVIRNLLEVLHPEGRLTLGHCEMIDGRSLDLTCLGNSTYQRIAARARKEGVLSARVLAVDDSPAVRLWLANRLKDAGLDAVTVGSAEEATEYLSRNSVDLITLDMNLPGQSGIAWLLDQRRIGLSVPVILFTDVSAAVAPNVLDALGGPAQDYVNKALAGSDGGELIDRVRSLIEAHRSRVEERLRRDANPSPRVPLRLRLIQPRAILIGASTGGTDALAQVLSRMPEDCPPVICVQHIPEEFAGAFRERLAAASGLRVGQIARSTVLLPGHLYIPVTDAHVGIRRSGERLSAFLSPDDRIMGHRPSVDYLFQSAAALRERAILACLLTGMGKDGARGLLELRETGAMTLAQDEQSSVVWGMPGEAVRLGAAMATGNPGELRAWILLAIRAGAGGARGGGRRA